MLTAVHAAHRCPLQLVDQLSTPRMAAGKDLLDSVDWKSVECLNAKPDRPLENALKQVRRERGIAAATRTKLPAGWVGRSQKGPI